MCLVYFSNRKRYQNIRCRCGLDTVIKEQDKIRYRATSTLRRPQIKQCRLKIGWGGLTKPTETNDRQQSEYKDNATAAHSASPTVSYRFRYEYT